MMVLIILGIFFISSIQPMMMIIMLIVFSIMYSMCVYMLMGSYWFGYLLLLVMMSGILVVFTYMVSLFPNENFEMLNLVMILFMFMFSMYSLYEMFMMDFSYISLNLWVMYMGIFNLFLVSFLLMIMVMVVWMSYLSEGAIRIMYE